MKRGSQLVLMIGLALLVGCNKLGPYKKDGDAKLAALKSVGEKAKAVPPLTADKIEPIKLWLTDDPSGGKKNTVIMDLEEFADLRAEFPSVKIRLRDDKRYFQSAASVLQGGPIYDDASFKEGFQRFFQIEHVVVIKVTALDAPKLTGDKQFKAGTVTGEAHVFSLDGTTYRGGVHFSGRSSATVSSTMKHTENDLLVDLGRIALADLERQLKAQLPDSH